MLDSIGIMGGLGGKVGCAFEDSEDAYLVNVSESCGTSSPGSFGIQAVKTGGVCFCGI